MSKSTVRNKITGYIATTLKSRQEFKPLIGTYIDRAKAEPLHLKNNTVKEQFIKLLKIAMAKTNFGKAKNFGEVNPNSLFVKFVEFVHGKMGLNLLSKKIKIWFNENNGKADHDFSFRFRGKESFLFMRNFPELILLIFKSVTKEDVKLRLSQIHFQCICLRKIHSLSVRIIDFDKAMANEMELVGRKLFKASCLFEQKVSPSLWTVCNISPTHARVCLESYSLGLGCNTMEGREQKHQTISKYSENTTYQNRWPLIFRHEFVQLIFLRENGFDNNRYNKRIRPYIPLLSKLSCSECVMDLASEDASCFLCSSACYKKVKTVIG